MEKNPSPLSDQVLNLTLEIIFLLTGEDYFLVKKPSSRAASTRAQVVEGTSRTQADNHITQEPQNKKKILEVTKKIISLLTKEVPIRCQDVTVYFSMEEWEYLEGHKDLYKEVMMDDHQTPTSPGLPKYPLGLVKEEEHEGRLKSKVFTLADCPPTNIKEEPVSCHGGYLTGPNLYTSMDSHRQRYPVTYVKEEPSFSGGRQDQEVTQQYQPSHVKDDPVPQNRRTPARSNIYPKKDLAEERSPPYRRKKPVPCGNRNLKPKAQDGAPTREKDGLISHDPTHASIYVIKDLTQQCSSPGTKETPVPCGGEKPHHHPSTQVKEDTSLSDPNPPGTQTMASDHISVQHSCSECQKCFVSMEELVSHQGIHLVEKLFQNGNRVFTTTFMSIPQEAPVKLKLLRCSKCDRTFSTKSSLVVHMKTHWPKQYEIFRCEKCGKYLFSRSQLDRHLRGHF